MNAIDELLEIAVRLDSYLRDSTTSTGMDRASAADADPERAATVLGLVQDLIGAAVAMMSGEPGLASFLRRGMLGPLGLGGRSLPLDVWRYR